MLKNIAKCKIYLNDKHQKLIPMCKSKIKNQTRLCRNSQLINSKYCRVHEPYGVDVTPPLQRQK